MIYFKACKILRKSQSSDSEKGFLKKLEMFEGYVSENSSPGKNGNSKKDVQVLLNITHAIANEFETKRQDITILMNPVRVMIMNEPSNSMEKKSSGRFEFNPMRKELKENPFSDINKEIAMQYKMMQKIQALAKRKVKLVDFILSLLSLEHTASLLKHQEILFEQTKYERMCHEWIEVEKFSNLEIFRQGIYGKRALHIITCLFIYLSTYLFIYLFIQ